VSSRRFSTTPTARSIGREGEGRGRGREGKKTRRIINGVRKGPEKGRFTKRHFASAGVHGEKVIGIDIRPLKEFARKKMPLSPLREVLLIEEDVIDANAFLAKLPLWLRLSWFLGEPVETKNSIVWRAHSREFTQPTECGFYDTRGDSSDE
jgi:hypothetical protein